MNLPNLRRANRTLRVHSGCFKEQIVSFEFALYDAIKSIDIPVDKARAVVDALEHDMGSTLATKQSSTLQSIHLGKVRRFGT